MRKAILILTCVLVGTGGPATMTWAGDDPPPPRDGSPYGFHDIEGMLLAQAPSDSPRGMGPGPGFGRGQFRKHMKHLEQLRVLKMLEMLDLDDDQEIPFLTAFSDMRDAHRELDVKIDALLDTLAQGLQDGSVGDARINELVNQVVNLEDAKRRIILDFVDKARVILTPAQLGKFVIFQKRFESHLLEQVGRFRQGVRPGGQDLLDGDG
jgi:hypothetical protein